MEKKLKREEEPKLYTFSDLMAARDEERNRVRIIIEYLLNKSSYSTGEWKHAKQLAKPLMDGIDYARFYEDMEDLENSLID